MAVRITVHVQPGARHPRVGGSHGGALVVRVAERAVDGRATAAALTAIAAAFALHTRDVVLVSGATSRTKIVEVVAAEPGMLDELLAR